MLDWAVLGSRLDRVILEASSNLNNSVFPGSIQICFRFKLVAGRK